MSYPHYGGHGHGGHWQPQHGQPPPQYAPHHTQPPVHPHAHHHQQYAPPPQHQHYAAPQQPYHPQPQYNPYPRAPPPPPPPHAQPPPAPVQQYRSAPPPRGYAHAPPTHTHTPTHAHAHGPPPGATPAPAPVPPGQQYYHQTYPQAAPTPALGGYRHNGSGSGLPPRNGLATATPEVAARGIPSASNGVRARRVGGGGEVDTTRARLDVHARRAFTNADKDKNGYITFREFLSSLRDLDAHVPYHDALDTFSKLDTDNDGRIVETEFVNGYLSRNGSFS